MEEEGFQQKSPNLTEVPKNLWVISNTDTGTIKSTEPIKIQRHITKPLPQLPQYPLKPEATQSLTPATKDLISQGVIIPCISPHDTQILPAWKPNG